uniref:B9 domain-containing protein 2 n=1 Tax=Phaeocystis antarctica TaxID=33657 RepID=A0A7S0F771_9EUKA|mmetsp:Transcript_49506/g.119247  ORF Transcript_49506/g.119247 Transcript_49506/m.119247 type:complete len:178 (-) Transcript_49506:203-736(-)
MAAAELHLLGQLTGASGFPLSSLFCKFSIESGSNFRVLQGVVEGQTQCDQPNEEEMAVWSHPIDVHYTLKGIDGWPRLKLEVWGVDGFGRNELVGYGVCMLPTSPGLHELRCATWRPCGSMREQISTFFLGGVPTLKHKEVITQPIDRFRLQTEPSGDVHLTLGVLTKDFARYGVSS